MFAYCSICGAIDPTVTFKSAGFKTSPAIPPECLWRRVYNRSGSFGTIRRMRISEALNSRIYINMFIFGSKYIQVYLRRREKVAHLWQQWPAVRTLKALIKNVGFAQICKFATKRNLSCLWICKNKDLWVLCALYLFCSDKCASTPLGTESKSQGTCLLFRKCQKLSNLDLD